MTHRHLSQEVVTGGKDHFQLLIDPNLVLQIPLFHHSPSPYVKFQCCSVGRSAWRAMCQDVKQPHQIGERGEDLGLQLQFKFNFSL